VKNLVENKADQNLFVAGQERSAPLPGLSWPGELFLNRAKCYEMLRFFRNKKKNMKPRARNLKHRQNFSFATGSALPVRVPDIRVTVKKPVKQNPRIIDIPNLCWELNKVGAAAELTGSGFRVNKIEIRIPKEGFAEYGTTKVRFSDCHDLLKNLILDRILTLTKQDMIYISSGYNRKEKNRRNVKN
jgi:hypothetical protein